MKSTRVLTTYMLAALCAACGGQGRTAPVAAAGAKSSGNEVKLDAASLRAMEQELRLELDSLRNLRFVGMDDGPVPGFELRAANGAELDSQALVGREPFVVIFFATWCELCQRKLYSVQRALDEVGRMPIIAVSMDGPETWREVPGYLQAAGIQEPAVRAADYPRFVLSYNPFSTVPLLVIVGRNGGLVDYQLGFEPEHEGRLVASLRLARTIGPLARPRAERALEAPAFRIADKTSASW